jgi:hypothetical protein
MYLIMYNYIIYFGKRKYSNQIPALLFMTFHPIDIDRRIGMD